MGYKRKCERKKIEGYKRKKEIRKKVRMVEKRRGKEDAQKGLGEWEISRNAELSKDIEERKT